VPPGEITRLLRGLARGGEKLSEELLARVYRELKAIAQSRMAAERPGHTLQPTALVHEAYLRLMGDGEADWDSRGHFYAAAAEAMRRILIEHARQRGAAKRGGGRERVPLASAPQVTFDKLEEIVAVDEALSRMQEDNPRGVEIVRLRYFAGLGIDDVAHALKLSPRTVRREWLFVRAELYRALRPEEDR